MRSLRRDWLQVLPGRMLRPMSYLPRPMTRQGAAVVCNRIFETALFQGELDFLAGRVLRIQVEDAGIELVISSDGKRLHGYSGPRPPDVTIHGTTHNLMFLVSRREDADTLFFQRRLGLEGDTELGLHLKNFLDAWEPPAGVQLLQRITGAWLGFTETVASDGRMPHNDRSR